MPSERPCSLATPGLSRALSPLLAALALLSACDDPVQDAAAAALGPEAPAVPPGPLHRPGQPCLVCHDGGDARAFSLAGTVFRTPESDEPAAGAEVHVIDSASRRFVSVTNCAGNFFVRPEELDPVFPLWVLVGDGSFEIEMDSPVRGDGSCAGCHGLLTGPASAGRVYLYPIEPAAGLGGCP